MISSAVTRVTTPARRAMMTAPESRATFSSSPVPTSGACGNEERHALPLHVRAHERAVGVVVLEERNQRRGDRDELLRRHVHEVDPVRRQRAGSRRPVRQSTSSSTKVPSALSSALACAIDRSPLRRLAASQRDLVGDLAVLDDAVRRLDEAEIVDPRVGRELT